MGFTNSIWEMQLVDRIAPFGLAVCHGLSSSVGSSDEVHGILWRWQGKGMKSMELIGKRLEKVDFAPILLFFSRTICPTCRICGDGHRRKFTDGKAEVGRVREEKRREEERRSEKKKSQKKDAGARKGRKVAIHCVFSNDLWLRRVEK